MLLAWQSLGEGRWRALVTYAVEDAGAVTLVQQRVPAELVRPLERLERRLGVVV